MIAASTGTLDLRADRNRRIAWLGLVVLLLSLLAPQLSIEGTAAAQTLTTQQSCDEGFVLNERTGECEREPQRVPGQITTECPQGTVRERETGACIPIPETTVPETETPVVTEEATEVPRTETATEVATEPPPPLGYAQAIKRACPEGFVPDETTTITELQDTCLDPVEGVLFHIVVGELAHASVPTDATGLSQLGSAPVGEIALAEEIPDGYGEPIVYCAEGYAFGPFEHTYTEEDRQPVLDGNAVAWTLPADTLLQCYFYNVFADSPDGRGDITTQGQAEGPGDAVTITNRKYACPQGAPHEEFSPGEMEELCNIVMDEVEFTFDDGVTPFTVETDGNGEAVWVDPPPGEVTISETIPDGFGDPYVTCRIGQANGPGLALVLLFGQVPGGELHLNQGDDPVSMQCRWTNVFADEGDDAGNTVTLRKFRCPLGMPDDSEDLTTWGQQCIAEHDGVDFTLDHAGGSLPGTTENGQIEWDNVPAGNIDIQESIPAGYLDPVVFCFSAPAGIATEPEMVPAAGGAFSLTIPQDGWQVTCEVFNLRDEAASSLTVRKRECPVGFDEQVLDAETHCTTPLGGVTFTLGDMEATTGDDQGVALFEDVPAGDHSLTEVLPDGYTRAFFGGCTKPGLEGPGPLGMVVPGENVPTVGLTFEEGDHWECVWYNVPEEPEDNEVEIHKWQCPEGTEPDQPVDWYEANCVQQHDGVWFAVNDGNGILSKPTIGGVVQFPDLPAGTVGIQETLPVGFGPPMVFCGIEGNPQHYPAPTGHWQYDFPNDGLSETLVCWVFNIPGEPPSITVNKWTCPPGYDFGAAGSDPKMDCTEATDGVTLELRISGQAAIEESQTTGDVIAGGVIFDELQPDTYQITELVPPGIASVFVLECTGHIMGVLQPDPLSTSNVLDDIDLDAGEHLVCDWYNVPEHDGGRVIVTKHVCATETFVSEVDCEIYEDGATFDLLWWDGAAWQVIDTGITDGVGLIVWTGLDSGTYWLDEHDGEWCHIEVYPPPTGDNSFDVDGGEDTVVDVYNCDPGWTTTTIPEKYPNTGVPPHDGDLPDDPNRLPAAHLLTAMLATSITRRRLAALAAASLGTFPGRSLAQPGGTPVAAPARPCLPATPAAGDEADCIRGSVPATLRIDAIGVDAPVEILEVVGGVMQQPTDEVHVAWYKESARLGEIGNIWLAGHLNWWTTPVAVFSDLGLLRTGDEVVLLDADGNAFTYAVEWVRQESNLEPPREEVLGMTNHTAVTLITCSGEWNNEISEYDARTVVRAVATDLDDG